MVQFCCVVGCGNRSNRENKGFYRLPNVPKKGDRTGYKTDIVLRRRKQWLLNIRRADLRDGDAAYSPGYIRVCSDHFLSGRPSAWWNIENIDWAPTLNMGYGRSDNTSDGNKKRRIKSTTARNRAKRLKEFGKQRKKLLKSQLKELLNFKQEHSPENASVEEKVTFSPIIHKITADCIVESPVKTEIVEPIERETVRSKNLNELL